MEFKLQSLISPSNGSCLAKEGVFIEAVAHIILSLVQKGTERAISIDFAAPFGYDHWCSVNPYPGVVFHFLSSNPERHEHSNKSNKSPPHASPHAAGVCQSQARLPETHPQLVQ